MHFRKRRRLEREPTVGRIYRKKKEVRIAKFEKTTPKEGLNG
jgi:hypothetical protein